MTDLEKKQFMRTFIESIEMYPEKKDNESDKVPVPLSHIKVRGL